MGYAERWFAVKDYLPHPAGQTYMNTYALNEMPMFIREGSVLPTSESSDYNAEFLSVVSYHEGYKTPIFFLNGEGEARGEQYWDNGVSETISEHVEIRFQAFHDEKDSCAYRLYADLSEQFSNFDKTTTKLSYKIMRMDVAGFNMVNCRKQVKVATLTTEDTNGPVTVGSSDWKVNGFNAIEFSFPENFAEIDLVQTYVDLSFELEAQN
jgi:hypothetical protein